MGTNCRVCNYNYDFYIYAECPQCKDKGRYYHGKFEDLINWVYIMWLRMKYKYND